MSDTVNESPEAVESDDSAEPADTEHQDDAESMNAEAAKWRRRLRDTQAELESATAQLDRVQRQQVEYLLTRTGVKPDAVFAVTGLSDLLDEDGGIDAEKLAAAVATASDRFGIVKPPKGNHVPGVGGQPSVLPRVDAWRNAFSPRSR